MTSNPRWTEETEQLVAMFGPHADPDMASRRRCLSCRDWARPVLTALADAGLLLPPGGETREEWGVRWHADSADGIVLSEYQIGFESVARQRGEARIGDYGIRGFTLVRRTHTRYESGDWSTKWERVGEPWWRPEPQP